MDSYRQKISIKFFQKEHAGNWAANTNYALSLASGDYACILHQDDVWLEERLKVIKGLIEKHPETNLFLNPSWFIDAKGNRLGLWKCPLPEYPASISAELMTERLLIQNFISIVAPVFKKGMALKVGGLDEKLWFTPDWDFWLKYAALGKIMYYPKPLSAFRIHPGSQAIVSSKDIADHSRQLRVVFERYLQQGVIPEDVKKKIRKVAGFSLEIDSALAGLIHGHWVNIFRLVLAFIALGPSGWHRYFRDSRIMERVFARIGLLRKKNIDG
jgi:glycosyltransferase involved in cell wall biosynthesis